MENASKHTRRELAQQEDYNVDPEGMAGEMMTEGLEVHNVLFICDVEFVWIS